jgi:hypothetical protein
LGLNNSKLSAIEKPADSSVHGALIDKMQKGFSLFEGKADESGNVSDGVEEEEKVTIVDRIAAGFGGLFNQENVSRIVESDKPSDDKDTSNITIGSATNKWLQSKVGAGMMDKIGRSTWANLVKEAKKQNMALPDRHTSKLKIDEEDDDNADPGMSRVEGLDDSSNQFNDELMRRRRQTLLQGLNFDESRDSELLKKKKIPEPDNFVIEEDFDENEPFSEFKFRSFKKDRQIRQDYTLIDIDDPEDLSTLVASQVFPDSELTRESIQLVGIDEQQLI